MLFHIVAFILVYMAAKITAYFKDSDWLLKNFDQQDNGLKSYHGEQNRGYHVKEHKKLDQKLVSKVTLHFVQGHLSRKQTVQPATKQFFNSNKHLKRKYFLLALISYGLFNNHNARLIFFEILNLSIYLLTYMRVLVFLV